MMLWILWFFHVIEHHNMWHVDAVRCLGAENTSHSLELVLSLQVESSSGQSAQRWKSSTDTKTVKCKWRTLWCQCPLCSFAFIEQNPNLWWQQGETSLPHSRSLSPSSYRTPFYLSDWSEVKASAFKLTRHKHPVKCHTGDDKHGVACQCGMTAMSPIGCHIQGFCSLVRQLLEKLHVSVEPWWQTIFYWNFSPRISVSKNPSARNTPLLRPLFLDF